MSILIEIIYFINKWKPSNIANRIIDGSIFQVSMFCSLTKIKLMYYTACTNRPQLKCICSVKYWKRSKSTIVMRPPHIHEQHEWLVCRFSFWISVRINGKSIGYQYRLAPEFDIDWFTDKNFQYRCLLGSFWTYFILKNLSKLILNEPSLSFHSFMLSTIFHASAKNITEIVIHLS